MTEHREVCGDSLTNSRTGFAFALCNLQLGEENKEPWNRVGGGMGKKPEDQGKEEDGKGKTEREERNSKGRKGAGRQERREQEKKVEEKERNEGR